MACLSDSFFTWRNLLTVLRQTSINAVIATGMTFAILIGGIDLSVGSVLAICGAIAANLIASGMDIILAILITLFLGLAIGIVNGLLISKGRLQPFIATLGTMTLLRGFTLVYTQGKPIGTGDGAGSLIFGKIGSGYILGLPIPVYIMIIVFVIAYYILRHLRMGRYIYALGSNEEATVYSGIKTDKVKLFVYGASGILAALAGIIVTARLGSAQPTAGAGYELDAIAAVVLGGTSMSGGVGTIGGTAIGALIIGILNNALNLLQVPSYYQDVAKGAVILFAVLLDRKQKAAR
nr:ribose ABC transporter permease [Aminipila terrae]